MYAVCAFRAYELPQIVSAPGHRHLPEASTIVPTITSTVVAMLALGLCLKQAGRGGNSHYPTIGTTEKVILMTLDDNDGKDVQAKYTTALGNVRRPFWTSRGVSEVPLLLHLQHMHPIFRLSRPIIARHASHPIFLILHETVSEFSSSPRASIERLHRSLQIAAQDRWGLVFYRCTYTDQPAWLKFQQIVRKITEDFLSFSQHSLKESLEWTFVEDSNALDGASREDLRAHFRAWRDSAAQREQSRAKPLRIRGPKGIILDPYFKNPRYHLFVEVDEESLQSVILALCTVISSSSTRIGRPRPREILLRKPTMFFPTVPQSR